MDLQSAVRNAGLERIPLGPGYVCQVRDNLIEMPDNEQNRDVHHFRHVLIVSSDFICATRECTLVTVAPLSTVLKWKKPNEIVIKQTKTNGLTSDSRLMLGHLQPIHKSDIEKKLGEFSLDEWEDAMVQIIKNFDRA
jgi:mRNA-degrading endonuclease toxin of MazEF toxin-antitoxin module